MTNLADWLEFGIISNHAANKRLVRRWMREHRQHLPVIDRISEFSKIRRAGDFL